MGTVFSFDIRQPGVPRAAVEDAVALLHHIDRTFSTYRTDSVVGRLNRGEIGISDVDDETRDVLAQCTRWQERTDGWFSAYAAGGLEPSGYVKGWAIGRVSDLLRAAGSTRHCVNGGGDVQCVGQADDDRPWTVGIADPRDRSRLVTTVSGADLAVATSGTGERGRHIIDPHTGAPAADFLLSLTVSGRSIIECDVYATAGFAMGAGARDWFTGRDDVHAFAVQADGATWSTFTAAAERS